MKKSVLLFLSVIFAFGIAAPPAFAGETENSGSGLPEVRITLTDGLTLKTINSGSKDIKYEGNTAVLVDADGSEDIYTDVEMKGRGNFTWTESKMKKKPYQIKFSSKTEVFGMAKAKKWVLLANYADGTLMRNKLAFDLAADIGMPYAPESVWVDLYVNDEYIGNYLLCEKNEIGSGRIPLQDEYGVLCEVDNTYGTAEEIYFKTGKNNIVVLSDSVADDIGKENSVSEEAFRIFCNKLSRLEELLYDKTATWEEIEKLIDVESFIKYYFIQELVEDQDGCSSSVFMWSDGADDVIHLGPVWDFDSAMGAYTTEATGGKTDIDYTYNIMNYMGADSFDWFKKLLAFEEFDIEAIRIYNETIKFVFNSIPQRISGYMTDSLIKSAEMNFNVWKILGETSVFGWWWGHAYAKTYSGETDYLSSWLTKRVSYLGTRYASGPVFCTHSHKPEKVNGQLPTCLAAGWKDYYYCGSPYCGRYFSDADAKNEITNLAEWKQNAGKVVSGVHTPGISWVEDIDGEDFLVTRCKVCGEILSREEIDEDYLLLIAPATDGTVSYQAYSPYETDVRVIVAAYRHGQLTGVSVSDTLRLGGAVSGNAAAAGEPGDSCTAFLVTGSGFVPLCKTILSAEGSAE